MFKSIKITNFQSHQDTELEFHPGVNVLVGSSDSGKSAIFRAMSWVMTNRPLGNTFCRWGTKKTQVELTIDQDITIGRTKSKSENNYIFQDKELLAGTEVPEDIQRILKIDPMINIQQQISAPFLLASSPGEVASFFNEIAGLSDIDLSLKNLKSWQAMYIRTIKQLNLNIEKHQAQVLEMKYLDEAELKIKQLEDEQKKLDQIQADQKQIKDLIHKHSRCSETLDEVSVKANALNSVNKLIQKTKDLEVMEQKVEILKKTIQGYSKAHERLLLAESKAGALERITSISNKMDRLVQIQGQITGLKKVWINWTSMDTALRTKQNELERLQNKISDMMPNICPLCNQEIK
jgi:DNA repair exonuclease SbcCD ATPase subunit